MSSWRFREPGSAQDAFLYTNGIRFISNKEWPCDLKGHWQGKVFFSVDSAGKDVETATILDDGSLKIHASFFYPADTKDYFLHQVIPGRPIDPVFIDPAPPPDPGPKLAWPPPKGTITIGMTREDLDKLPWHRDGLQQLHDNPRVEVWLYTYHCDDSTLLNLTVTVKNGRVALINGGNG